MKVLYISNNSGRNYSEALSWFQPFCESTSDLIYQSHFSSAKSFLSQKVIGGNKHLDFIISDWIINYENAKQLLSWIRGSNEIYSDSNFQFRSVPFLLIEDPTSQSSLISEGFDGVVKYLPDPFNLLQNVKSAIKKWRYALADDLDLIGLDPKTQKIYPNHRGQFISYYKLKVLSRKFVDNKSKKLNYIWTSSEINSMNDSNDAFIKKMYWTRRNPPKYLEKEFHQFFIANPTFIKGEDFFLTKDQLLYEKHLYKNGTNKYDEPDFINKPLEYALRNPEIFEIKRHTQRILRYSKGSFLSNAKKSFEQVKRYKNYMLSDNPLHQDYIIRYLGRIFDSYEFTLLMGSFEEKQEHADLIQQLKSDFNFDDINLITYEELLHRHLRLCDRLNSFSIF